MAEGGIGSVSVSVVPDSTDFWRRFEAQTRGNQPTLRVRVEADTARARAEINSLGTSTSSSAKDAQKQVHLLRDAILLLGPAAVPIAAVAGGALLGLLPTLAAVGLGVAGIRDEMKSGALAGTQYAKDFSAVGAEYAKLKQIAAAGLLPGIDKAIRASSGEFGRFNSLIGETSTQVGQIIAGVGPGLLRLLDELGPLFTTIGADLADGAEKFAHWAQSSDSVSKFVSYVQTELPQVEHTLAELLITVGHLIQGFAPFGSTVVRLLGLVSGVLNAIPVHVLTDLETAALSAYAGFRVYQGVNAIITSVNTAVAGHAATVAASAASVEASALAEQSIVAEASAAEATARATLAGEIATAQAEIAAALLGTGSAFEAEAVAAATASAEEAVAFQAAADAALAASAEISAAALAAAETASTAGAAAGVGFAAMLGPIAAVVAGVALLGFTMFGSADDTRAATEAQNAFADSVKRSTVASSEANQQAALQKLNADQMLTSLDALHAKGMLIGTSSQDLVAATTGPLSAARKVVADINTEIGKGVSDSDYDKLHGLGIEVDNLRAGLQAQIQVQLAFAAAQRASQTQIDGGTASVKAQAGALGVSGTAYLDAQIAAQKSTDQTRAQTLAFQLENDAASLLTQTLDRLSGRTIGTAEAATALRAANLAVAAAIKQNGTAISGGSAKAVANQQAFQGQARAAIAYAEALGKATGSSKAEVDQLRASRDALEANLKEHGKLTPALKAYIDGLYSLSKLHVPPTKLDADATQAKSKIRAMQSAINAIRQGKVPGLDAETRDGKNAISALQSDIDAMKQHHKPTVDAYTDDLLAKVREAQNYLNSLHDKTIYVNVKTSAGAGGSAVKNAAGNSSVPDGWFTVGEGGPGARPELGYKSGSHLAIYPNSVASQVAAAHGVDAPGLAPMFASGTDNSMLATALRMLYPIILAALHTDPTSVAGSQRQVAITQGRAINEREATIAAHIEYDRLAASAAKAAAAVTHLSGASDKEKAAAQKAAAAAAKLADSAKARWQALGSAADAAAQQAGQAAALMVTNFNTAASNIASRIYDFRSSIASGLSGGTSIVSLWSNNGVGDASTIQQRADAFIAAERIFAADLTTLAKLGLSPSELSQIVGLGAESGDALAKQLIALGPGRLKALNTSLDTIANIAGAEGATLAKGFYGSGAATLDSLVKGMSAHYPAFAAALAPIIAKIESLFHFTPVVTAPKYASGPTSLPHAAGFSPHSSISAAPTFTASTVSTSSVGAVSADMGTVTATLASIDRRLKSIDETAPARLADAGAGLYQVAGASVARQMVRATRGR